jgi:hypothetical protein
MPNSPKMNIGWFEMVLLGGLLSLPIAYFVSDGVFTVTVMLWVILIFVTLYREAGQSKRWPSVQAIRCTQRLLHVRSSYAAGRSEEQDRCANRVQSVVTYEGPSTPPASVRPEMACGFPIVGRA